MGLDYELYEAPDRKFGSMSEVSSIEGLSSWMNNPKLLLERDDDKRPLLWRFGSRFYFYLLNALSILSDDQAGEWDGMVAELVNKKADIALGSLRFF